MNDMKRDLIRIQELVGMAFSETGSLVALTDGGQIDWYCSLLFPFFKAIEPALVRPEKRYGMFFHKSIS